MSIEKNIERIADALEHIAANGLRVSSVEFAPAAQVRAMDPCHDNGKVHVATAEKPAKTTGLFDSPESQEALKKSVKPKKVKAEVVETVPTPPASSTKVSEDDVRAAMTKLVTAPGCGTAPAIKILKSYGVSKVSELSEADYSRIHAEFLAAIPQG